MTESQENPEPASETVEKTGEAKSHADFWMVVLITATLLAMLAAGLAWAPEQAGGQGVEALERPALPAVPRAAARGEDPAARRLASLLSDTSEEEKSRLAGLAAALADARKKVAAQDAARAELLAAGDKAVPALLDLLQGEEQDGREAAARAFGELESNLAVEALARALSDEAWEVQAAAAQALGLIGDRSAVPDLLLWRESGKALHKAARVRVAEALVRLGNGAGLPALVAALTADIFNIRIALRALRRHTGASFAMNPYALRTEREDAALRWERWFAGRRGRVTLEKTSTDRTNAERLARRIEEEISRAGGERYFFMLQAKSVLTALGEPALPHVLAALYRGEPGEAYHPSFHVRSAACHIIETLAGAGVDCRGAVPHLLFALATDANPSVRAQAVQALGTMGDRRAVAVLGRAFTSDPEKAVRLEAAVALGRLGFRDSEKVLAAAATEERNELSMEVRAALERVRGGTGILAYTSVLAAAAGAGENTLAETAHLRLIEVTGRNPLKAESLSTLPGDRRAAIVTGWKGTAARWSLVADLAVLVDKGDLDAAARASTELGRQYRLHAVPSLDRKKPHLLLRYWEGVRRLWQDLSAMDDAVQGGDRLAFAHRLRDLEARFGERAAYHSAMGSRELGEVLSAWTAWARTVDPF